MTPREKAEELFEKIGLELGIGLTVDHNTTAKEIVKTEKKLALICVDEILLELQSYSDRRSDIFINDKYVSVVERLIYWNEVKTEIEKL